MSDSESDSGSDSGDRTQISTQNLTVATSAIFDTPGKISPAVGYFSSGYNPTASGQNPDVRVFHDARHVSSRMDLVVRPKGENSAVEFVGSSYTDATKKQDRCTYALGVLDKDTGTLKIVQIAANKIFRLEPRVIKSPYADAGPAEEVVDEKNLKDMTREDLSMLYGTKKQKRMDSKYSTLKKLGQTSRGEHLEYLNDDEPVKEENETAVLNIPPHDPSAVMAAKVYLIDEIIFKSERSSLLDILKSLQSDDSRKTQFWEEMHYPAFVINRLNKLKVIQSDKERDDLACKLSYIRHLVNFLKLIGPARRTKSSPRISSISGEALNKYKIPRVVLQKFMKLFVDTQLNIVPTEKRELLIGYILVLTLFVDEFNSDPSDIAKDLAIPSLNLYYLQLGCKIVRGNWTLPVPVKLQPVMKRKPKRQR